MGSGKWEVGSGKWGRTLNFTLSSLLYPLSSHLVAMVEQDKLESPPPRPVMNAYTLDFRNILEISDRQFYDLCRQNPDVKFERNATGDLIIMAPTGGETGNRNIEIAAEFVIWNRRSQSGYLFDSSTGFRLPNGAHRSPDLAWVAADRWLALSPEQREKFPPIAPDFVLELRSAIAHPSPSDSLTDLQAKMAEYITNGVQLAWLIDRPHRTVTLYRPDLPPEVLPEPTMLGGEPVLPGFQLDLSFVW